MKTPFMQTPMKKILQRFKYSALLVAVAATIGCDDDAKVVDSDHVATGQIYATFQVMSDGSGEVHAEAQLTKDVPPDASDEPDTFVRLVNKDELWLSVGPDLTSIDFSDDLFGTLAELDGKQIRFRNTGTELEFYSFIFFRQIINSFGTWYSAALPQSDEREYRVAFLRERDYSSTVSSVVLPEPFSILAPTAGETLSREMDDFILEWSNPESGVDVEIEVNTTCTDSEFDTFTEVVEVDTGIFILPAGTLDSPALTGNCSSTINLRKSRSGELDARFVGGAVIGYQIRRIVISSSP